MFLSNSKKNCAGFVVLLLACSACRFFQTANSDTTKPFTPEEIKSEIPFATKEPEIFQTEIVITANNQENKKFIARNAENRRCDYNFGAKNQVTVLQTDKFLKILTDKKIYTEDVLSKTTTAQESWSGFLTNEWLNAKTDANYTKIGTENNLTQYRVNFEDAENAKSEMLIFIDENINLPVRQEFYSTGDGQRILTLKVELRNFKPEAAADLFSVPKDFKKVSAEEFRKILQSEEYK
ncbi:hypothetical protein BH10ACI1_BH10ACI1_29030 [soil metagenome]